MNERATSGFATRSESTSGVEAARRGLRKQTETSARDMSEGHGHGGPLVGPVMMFSPLRQAVAQFYADVIGLSGDTAGDDVWLEAGNAKVVVHDPHDRQTPQEIRAQTGFVVWFGVPDLRAAFDRAKHAGALASEFLGDFFFARDPDGRYVGVYTLEDAHGHDHEH